MTNHGRVSGGRDTEGESCRPRQHRSHRQFVRANDLQGSVPEVGSTLPGTSSPVHIPVFLTREGETSKFRRLYLTVIYLIVLFSDVYIITRTCVLGTFYILKNMSQSTNSEFIGEISPLSVFPT